MDGSSTCVSMRVEYITGDGSVAQTKPEQVWGVIFYDANYPKVGFFKTATYKIGLEVGPNIDRIIRFICKSRNEAMPLNEEDIERCKFHAGVAFRFLEEVKEFCNP